MKIVILIELGENSKGSPCGAAQGKVQMMSGRTAENLQFAARIASATARKTFFAAGANPVQSAPIQMIDRRFRCRMPYPRLFRLTQPTFLGQRIQRLMSTQSLSIGMDVKISIKTAAA